MITLEEKETLWRNVLKEFPSDLMLRDIHFTRELMTAIRKRAEKVVSYRDRSDCEKGVCRVAKGAPGTGRQAMIAQPLAAS